MSKVMKWMTAFSLAAAIFTTVLYFRFNKDIYLISAVTFGTTFYHLGMRLLVGLLYNVKMKNRADYTKSWFQVHSWENQLYQLLKVKTWKNKMPTFNPEAFSIRTHTWDEIAQTMCQSELVHETNIVLSFIPLAASKWFGSFYVFLITSVCSAVFDLLFVMMQRYNRARIIKIASRHGPLK